MTLLSLFRRTVPAAVLALCLAGPAQSADPPLSPAQQDAVREIVRDYILKNPEIIIESVNALRARAEGQEQARRQAALRERVTELRSHPASPVAGNPKGDATLVEFFDYRCPYCKRMAEPLMELMKQDRQLRVVFKELPILAPDSRIAARAALAANRQGKYLAVHMAFLAHRGAYDEATVVRLATEQGVERERLLKDMRDPEIEAEIERNLETARILDIRGTPTFIAGETILPGAVELEQLREAIAKARKGG